MQNTLYLLSNLVKLLGRNGKDLRISLLVFLLEITYKFLLLPYLSKLILRPYH
jgi:hypothetical protein